MRNGMLKFFFVFVVIFGYVFSFSNAVFAAEGNCSFPNPKQTGKPVLDGKCYKDAPALSVCEVIDSNLSLTDCTVSGEKCCASCVSDAEYQRTCSDSCSSADGYVQSSTQVCSTKTCCEKKKSSINTNSPNTVYFDQNSYSVKSNQSSVTVGIKRTAGNGLVSVQYKTYDSSAVAGTDYTTTEGTVTWQASETDTKSVNIPIKNGFSGIEPLTKEFFVKLENPQGEGVSIPRPMVTIVIENAQVDAVNECVDAKNPDGSKKGYSCKVPSDCVELAPGNDVNLKCYDASAKCCKVPKVPAVAPTSSNSAYTLFEQIPGTPGRTMQFPEYIAALYKFLIWGVVFAAILMVMIGGFWYLTAAGNTSQVGTAKKIISDALLGLVVILFTWLLLSIINPDLVSINLKSLSALKVNILAPSTSPTGGTTTPGANTAGPGTEPQRPPGNLAKGCENYKDAFNSAGVDACFLKAIATAESQCNPAAQSGAGACGIMQLLPSTAKQTCEYLKSHPEESIKIAADYFKQNQSTLAGYSGQFNIGNSFSLSGSNVSFGGYTYDTGNDDLIASYNAGAGRGPFSPSSDCPGAPKWQCNIDPGGFKETQNYVIKVQKYQKQCNGG